MSTNDFVKGAIAGAVIGGVATALSTPKSGEEVRELVKRAPDKAKDAFYEKLGTGVASKFNVAEITVKMKDGSTRTIDPQNLDKEQLKQFLST